MEILKPAQLDFFAIYSPALGPTDETLPDQLVYYHSHQSQESRNGDAKSGVSDLTREEQNEQLRNIGLAQGMVHFAQAFSDGDNVDYIDSEKSRIFMNEVEPGWWVLASVNLTQIRTTTSSSSSKGKAKSTQTKVEYSGREVSPHGLLLQQILDAHSIFLLHHGSSLAEMYKRLKRSKFCATLDRFWNKFLRNWDVLLHGSPAIDIFPGIKLAAGGELGIGVGEEEWGSGEREVLEDFTRRTSGLIDVVVSRFGAESTVNNEDLSQSWLRAGSSPAPADGMIYSGTGRITKRSLMAISNWMEWIYKQGKSAYGVQDNPHAPKRKRRKENAKPQHHGLDEWPTGIPSPLITTVNKSLAQATVKAATDHKDTASTGPSTNTDILMKYMTFGIYGSGWGLPGTNPTPVKPADAIEDKRSKREDEIKQESSATNPNVSVNYKSDSSSLESASSFLVGFQGNLHDESAEITEENVDGESDDITASRSLNNRISLRTLYVELEKPTGVEADSNTATASNKSDRIQVIVYINQPFIFTFLFELSTPTLGYTSFYRSIDHQLGPLRKPLLRSTALETVQNRFSNTVSMRTVTSVDSKQPIYDLIYDPINYTIHSTIPSIPDVHNLKAEWSRLDALNVHSQIVNTYLITKHSLSTSERTAKTARGWWVVWIKFPPGENWQSKEAFLVRKASDYIEEGSRKGSIGFAKDLANLGSSAGRVAEGIGIDARRYVEGLIAMSR